MGLYGYTTSRSGKRIPKKKTTEHGSSINHGGRGHEDIEPNKNPEISKAFPPERKEEIFRLKIYAQMNRACDSFILKLGGPGFFDRKQDELRIAEKFC